METSRFASKAVSVEKETFRATSQDLYNDLGKTYEDAYAGNEGQEKSLRWLIHRLPKGATVLDIGCGTGIPACKALSDAGLAVTGVDSSPVMLSHARACVPQATFVQADLLSFEPASGAESLDAIVAYFSLIGHITQEEIRGFFRRTHNLLKPGGYFVFGTVALEGNEVLTKFMGLYMYSSSFSAENAVSEVKAAGFEVLQYEETTFVPRGKEAELGRVGELEGEPHLFIYARKTAS